MRSRRSRGQILLSSSLFSLFGGPWPAEGKTAPSRKEDRSPESRHRPFDWMPARVPCERRAHVARADQTQPYFRLSKAGVEWYRTCFSDRRRRRSAIGKPNDASSPKADVKLCRARFRDRRRRRSAIGKVSGASSPRRYGANWGIVCVRFF